MNEMTIDRAVIAVAGSFILVSLLLAHFHSGYWLWFTAFVGANLLQSAFTGFCPMAMLLKKLGIKPGSAF
ncbi:MAG: sulfurtransferase [Nitrosomonas sp.]|nr:MAG: sulfurtransferase [Nitrosomonas sp.]